MTTTASYPVICESLSLAQSSSTIIAKFIRNAVGQIQALPPAHTILVPPPPTRILRLVNHDKQKNCPPGFFFVCVLSSGFCLALTLVAHYPYPPLF